MENLCLSEEELTKIFDEESHYKLRSFLRATCKIRQDDKDTLLCRIHLERTLNKTTCIIEFTKYFCERNKEKGVDMNFLEKLLKNVLLKNLLLYNFLVTVITLFIFFVIFFLGSLLVLAIGDYIAFSANTDAASLGAILLTIIIPLVIGILDLALCIIILIVNLKFKTPGEE